MEEEFIFVEPEEITEPLNELLEILKEKYEAEAAENKANQEAIQEEFDLFIEKNSIDPEEFSSIEEIYFHNNNVQTENITALVDQQLELLNKVDQLIEQNEEAMNLDSTGFFFLAVTIAGTVAIRSLYDNLTKW